ncbi:MAG: hypothetical protein LBM95_06945 [Lactobacillales bacterium]|jgi:hypothetical protein|nr:hypothetical protein [Lactobacillales bacterium]
MEKIKNLGKKHKYALFTCGAIVVLAVGGGIAYKVHADKVYSKNVEEIKTELVAQTNSLESIEKQAGRLQDVKTGYLKKGLTSEEVAKLKKSLSSSLDLKNVKKSDVASEVNTYDNKASDIKGELAKIEDKLNAQTTVNKFYLEEKPAIDGNVVVKDLPIIDDLKADDVKSAKEKYYQAKLTKDTTTQWQASINVLIDNAEAQVKGIEDATKAVNDLFKDNKPQDNEDGYNKAKTQVDKLKNKKAKKALNDKLAQVKKVVDEVNKKEADEKAKAEAETKKTEEKSKAEAVAQQTGGKAVQNDDGSWSVSTPSGNVVTPDQAQQQANTGGGSTGGGNTGGGFPNTGGGNTGGGSVPDPEPSQPAIPPVQTPTRYRKIIWDRQGNVLVDQYFNTWAEAEIFASKYFAEHFEACRDSTESV